MRSRLAFALALLALSLSAAAPRRASASEFWDEVRTPGLRDWREDIERARAALRARRTVQARQAADAAVRRLPERALGYVLRGLAAGQGGDLAPAIADFEAALERDPASLDEPLDGARAAELLARGGRHDLAARVLGRVLGRMREGGGRRSLYALYGDVLLTLGPARLSDAVRAYREALRTAAHDPRAGIGLALALRRQAAASDGAASDEWRVLARRVAARGRLDALLSSIDVPESERAARRAVALEASGDRAAARNAWLQAENGPWAAQAHAAAEALE